MMEQTLGIDVQARVDVVEGRADARDGRVELVGEDALCVRADLRYDERNRG